jgi:uncharacterized protein YceH (UPF0502 family)
VNIQLNQVLNQLEVRVLGSLMEKETTTPDYYPLSLNALVNACNQKSNRDPVMDVDESAVREALYSLGDKGLAGTVSSAESRVAKYEHRMQEVFNFTRRESAIICVLMLRGPQTPGELRGRTERMFRFDDLADIQSTLQRLAQHDPPLAKMLARQPGTKEARYVHLLAGDAEAWDAAQSSASAAGDMSAGSGQIAALEEAVARLKQEVAALKKEFTDFRKQFEED